MQVCLYFLCKNLCEFMFVFYLKYVLRDMSRLCVTTVLWDRLFGVNSLCNVFVFSDIVIKTNNINIKRSSLCGTIIYACLLLIIE